MHMKKEVIFFPFTLLWQKTLKKSVRSGHCTFKQNPGKSGSLDSTRITDTEDTTHEKMLKDLAVVDYERTT